MFQASHQIIYAGLALGCALLATVPDVRERRIPNVLTGTAAIAGMLLHTGWDGWSGFVSSVEAGFLAGVLFFLLHLAGGMGAGDVKLMFAIGALNGLFSLQSVLIGTVLSGGFVAAVFCLTGGRLRQASSQISAFAGFLKPGRVRAHAETFAPSDSLRIPYAIPIAAGCLLNFAGRMR